MSTEYGPTIQWTEPGQGPVDDQQKEGRWEFHYTSDTCTWQWRPAGVGGPWINALTVSKEHFAALMDAANTPMENENDPQPQV